jgi:hypothetical protein
MHSVYFEMIVTISEKGGLSSGSLDQHFIIKEYLELGKTIPHTKIKFKCDVSMLIHNTTSVGNMTPLQS